MGSRTLSFLPIIMLPCLHRIYATLFENYFRVLTRFQNACTDASPDEFVKFVNSNWSPVMTKDRFWSAPSQFGNMLPTTWRLIVLESLTDAGVRSAIEGHESSHDSLTLFRRRFAPIGNCELRQVRTHHLRGVVACGIEHQHAHRVSPHHVDLLFIPHSYQHPRTNELGDSTPFLFCCPAAVRMKTKRQRKNIAIIAAIALLCRSFRFSLMVANAPDAVILPRSAPILARDFGHRSPPSRILIESILGKDTLTEFPAHTSFSQYKNLQSGHDIQFLMGELRGRALNACYQGGFMTDFKGFGWRAVRLLLLAIILMATGKFTAAQVLGSVSGRVDDTSGASISGAAVTVTDLETGATRTVHADDSGNYLVLSLPIGRYEIKAEKEGFKVAIQTGINLVVGQQAVVNLALEVGQVQQSVTVEAEAQVVNTTTAPITGLVSEVEVKDLPLNGRSYDALITLDTGAMNNVAHTTSLANGSGAGNQFGVEGRSPEENFFLLNGIEYSGDSAREILPGGPSGQLLGVDGIREFNLLTDAYSAEYGKRAGAQVSVITQSGTNQLHGTVFEFLRNSHLDARNFFDASPSQIGHRIPEFQRNQFGGALGGPIRKDKIFLFGNYEGFRQRLGVSDVAIVPDNFARMEELPVAGVETPVVGANPGMIPFFALWPTVNAGEVGTGSGGVGYNFSSPKQAIREDFGTTRADETLSTADSLSEVYTIDDGYNISPQTNPQFAGTYIIRNQVLSLQETHVFSPTKINIFRVGYTRAYYNFNIAPVVSLPADLSWFTGLEPGGLNIGGGVQQSTGVVGSVTGAGGSGEYEHGVRNLFTYSDDFQLVKGKHQFSFGVWFQPMQNNSYGASSKAGSVSFSSLTGFIQGIASNFTAVPNPHELGYRMKMGAWYAEDNINLRHNLTLRVGLRHEFTNGWNEADGRVGNFVQDPNTGLLETTPIVGKVFTQNNAKLLFSPRVNLAWDVFGNGKTAVRAGFGTYYDLLDNIAFELDTNPPYNALVRSWR